jgi:hypothetical protein
MALRRVLDDRRSEGSCIQTVPRRGYRFVAAVRQYERRPGAGVFCRRHGRGDHYGALPDDTWPCVERSLAVPSWKAVEMCDVVLTWQKIDAALRSKVL